MNIGDKATSIGSAGWLVIHLGVSGNKSTSSSQIRTVIWEKTAYLVAIAVQRQFFNLEQQKIGLETKDEVHAGVYSKARHSELPGP